MLPLGFRFALFIGPTVQSPVILTVAWPAILLASMALPRTFYRIVMLARRDGDGQSRRCRVPPLQQGHCHCCQLPAPPQNAPVREQGQDLVELWWPVLLGNSGSGSV
jgi:hypothetical protein